MDLRWILVGVVVLPMPIGFLWLTVYRARRWLCLPDWLSGILAKGIISFHRIVSGSADGDDYSFFAVAMGATIVICLLTIRTAGPVAAATVSSWVTPQDTVNVDNFLNLPARITVGDAEVAEVPAGGSATVELQGHDSLDWSVVQPIGPNSQSLGESMGATFTGLGAGSSVVVDNVIGNSFFFSPILTIKINVDCRVVMDEGLDDSNDSGLHFGPGTDHVPLGYYHFWTNSNVTVHCSNGTVYWWGPRASETNGVPLNVEAHSGGIDITIDH